MSDNERLRFQKTKIAKFRESNRRKGFDPRNPITLNGYSDYDFKAKNSGQKKHVGVGRPDFLDVDK